MASHHTSLSVPPQAALDELVGLYAELDARLAEFGVECRHCGRCCDFSRSDCRLYASFLELALVARRHRRPHLTPSGQCGFLADGRCSIHPLRPLGCRVFFCDPAYKPREQDLCHAFQRRLRALADRYRLPWDYALFLKESG